MQGFIFFKCQDSYEKLAYQVYQIGNANFACKILIQALWRNQ
jgi:hypothetical protein